MRFLEAAWVVAGLGLAGSPALAGDPEAFVAKIVSRNPVTLARFEGSGALVRHRGAVYVLTSEHVPLHDNDGSTHRLYLNGRAPMPITYVTSDWGVGLALLRVPAMAPTDALPELDDLAGASSPAIGADAWSAGFPAGSDAWVIDSEGRVSSTDTPSLVLARVERMLEVRGAHGEFGMSGGVVLTPGGALLGILSHESFDERGEKTLYAVPIARAASWAREFAEDPGALPELVRTSGDLRIWRGGRVRNGRLVIDWEPTDHGTGGISIGWDANAWKLDPTPPTRRWAGGHWDALYARIAPYLTDGEERGFRYPTGRIGAFRPRDLLRYRESTRVTGLVSFFRLMADPTLRPMARFHYAGQICYGRFHVDYRDAAEGLQRNHAKAPGALRAQLAALADLATIEFPIQADDARRKFPYEALSPADLDEVLGAPTLVADWTEFARRDRVASEAVRSSLSALQEVLRRCVL